MGARQGRRAGAVPPRSLRPETRLPTAKRDDPEKMADILTKHVGLWIPIFEGVLRSVGITCGLRSSRSVAAKLPADYETNASGGAAFAAD